jgi:hypothetical protein
MELIYYPATPPRDALPMMMTPLLPPSASSAKSTAAASAARARAVAAKSRDGGARLNLGLLRPRCLSSAGASPPVCLSFAGWLLRCLMSRASASRHLLSRSRLTHPDDGNHPSRHCHHRQLCRPSRRCNHRPYCRPSRHCHHRRRRCPSGRCHRCCQCRRPSRRRNCR